MTETTSVGHHSRTDAALRSRTGEGPTHEAAPRGRGRGLVTMTMIAILSLALGAWLIAAHYALGYPFNDGADDAFLNELLVGVVLLCYGYGRLQSPWRLPKLTAMAALAGAWLVAAPSVVGYGAEAPTARENDIACGILALLLAGAGAVVSGFRAARAAPPATATQEAAVPRQARARVERESQTTGSRSARVRKRRDRMAGSGSR